MHECKGYNDVNQMRVKAWNDSVGGVDDAGGADAAALGTEAKKVHTARYERCFSHHGTHSFAHDDISRRLAALYNGTLFSDDGGGVGGAGGGSVGHGSSSPGSEDWRRLIDAMDPGTPSIVVPQALVYEVRPVGWVVVWESNRCGHRRRCTVMYDSRSVVCIVCVCCFATQLCTATVSLSPQLQPWFTCSTCAVRLPAGICLTCAVRCHRGVPCDVPLLLVRRVFWMYDVYSFAFGVIVVAQGIE